MRKILIFFPILIFALEIKYKGLTHLSKVSANAIIGIHKELNLTKIDNSIKKLFKLGYFDDIKVDYSNGVLTFIFKEKPTIAKIEIKLSDELKKLLKEENLLPKKGELLDYKKIKKLKKFIKEYYLAKGYFNTAVNVEIKKLPKNHIKLIITCNKGKEVVIRDVKFYGSTLDKNELISKLENQPRDIFSILPFTNAGKLKIPFLLKDKETLQDYYYNLGYIDAKVSLPLANVNLDNYFADIEYHIKEGKRYKVKKVKIDPKVNISLNLKPNKYFNISALREDIKNITHFFMNKGYAFAKVFPEIKKEKNSLIVTYKVLPGEIYYINDVIIKGNTKTLDRVIRRNIYLAPNSKYSYTDYIDSINSLKRTGYFEKVDIKLKKLDKNKLNVIVNVKEGLTGTLRAGISYGSYTKLGFTFSLSEKNIFGSGQKITTNINYTSVSKTYDISLFNPRFLDTKYSFSFGIFNKKFESLSYTSNKIGGYLGSGKKLSRFLDFQITYGYTVTKLTDTNVSNIREKSKKSYIDISFNFNNTDDYFFPTKGLISNLFLEYAGVGGDEKFIKSTFKAKYHFPFQNDVYKTIAIFKSKIDLGMIKKIDYLPINEKFYLGGARSIRGFEWYSIAPKDKDGNLIGGNYKLIISPEISIPISLAKKIWLTTFIDYGMVGENKLNIKRSSYGFEINWITPVGPLQFIWAWPIKYKKEDSLRRFEFNIGTNF